ncbi:hypothetical protein GDO78_014217 [Eleutherodactylus coqui]|uniref:Uncharacterized protein n=1 Tax=Eleutherodactylus coqui TaxID=57060 RepID=A0A8J6EC16_ELECQ|nr:hypothetical protein GDO78_014217 [Eleutherodactylus coqui]
MFSYYIPGVAAVSRFLEQLHIRVTLVSVTRQPGLCLENHSVVTSGGLVYSHVSSNWSYMSIIYEYRFLRVCNNWRGILQM